MIYRGDCLSYVTMDCEEYGRHKIWYNPSNCKEIIKRISENWGKYWSELKNCYEQMLEENEQNGEAAWGIPEWLNDEWEIQIYDNFSEKSPMPKNRVIFRLVFTKNNESNVPIWDAFMDKFSVTHSQPVF